MKKIVTYILLAIFAFFSVGTSFVFYKQKHKIAVFVSNELKNKENLITLNFSKSQFQNLKWKTENKEFFLDGKLFDVASIEFNDNSVKIICYQDDRETKLFNWISNILSNNGNKKHPLKFLSQSLNSKYIPTNFSINRIVLQKAKIIDFHYAFSLKTTFLKIIPPPPEF